MTLDGRRVRGIGGFIGPMQGPSFVHFTGRVVAALERLGGSGRPTEVRESVAEISSLPDEALDERSAAGDPRCDDHVAWARFDPARPGSIDASKPGVRSLTARGPAAPEPSQDRAPNRFREVHAVFADARPDEDDAPTPATIESGEASPDQTANVGTSHGRREVLALVRSLPAAGFERASAPLLRASRFEHDAITGRSGDGGIDGIGALQVDPLVGFEVLSQGERDSGSVSPARVPDFRGATRGRAEKGILLTTGSLAADAKNEALRDGVPPIVLVDGEKLVGMFESLELGSNGRSRSSSVSISSSRSRDDGASDVRFGVPPKPADAGFWPASRSGAKSRGRITRGRSSAAAGRADRSRGTREVGTWG